MPTIHAQTHAQEKNGKKHTQKNTISKVGTAKKNDKNVCVFFSGAPRNFYVAIEGAFVVGFFCLASSHGVPVLTELLRWITRQYLKATRTRSASRIETDQNRFFCRPMEKYSLQGERENHISHLLPEVLGKSSTQVCAFKRGIS